MKVTPATKEDLAAVGALCRILFEEMTALQEGYFQAAEPDGRFLADTVESHNADLLVAKENGCLLGFALIQEQKTPPYRCLVPHRYGYITDLVVDPRQRGKGIGRMLVDAARDWAVHRKLDYIELTVLAENESAARFYEGTGFREGSRLLRLELPQNR